MGRIKDQLVGTWRFTSFSDEFEDGRVQFPYGRDVAGGLIYTSNDLMSLQLMSDPRPTLPETPTTEELRGALEGYIAYFGTYTVDEAEKVIVHHVRGSNSPSMVGTRQERPFELAGDRLTLRPYPFKTDGVVTRRTVVLERVGERPSEVRRPVEAQRLGGRVALVTGGGSGIGREAALAFAREGARVVVACRGVEAGEETASAIRDIGGEALFVRADVSKSEEVERLVARTVEAFGRLDCALNNAAVEGLGPRTADIAEEDFDYHLGVNLKGVWLCMKYELQQMLKQGGGSVVNMSSLNGLGGSAGASAYSASKHGVLGLTKSAAMEYAQSNIRVNAICAGAFRTPMLERVFEQAVPGNPRQAEAGYRSIIPMRRVGEPREAAEVVVWLCSDAASYVTGASVIVDGGMAAPLR